MPGIIDGPRGARKTELASVIEFQDYVFKTQHGEYPAMGLEAPHVFRECNAANQRIIREDGHIRGSISIYPAHVRWEDAVLKIGGVGGVSTHPESRGKGYARLLLEDVIGVLMDEEYDISILWGVKDLYRKFGWEPGGELWRFTADKGNIYFLPEPPDGEILTDHTDPAVWEGIRALHDAERRGVVRDTELTEIMTSMVTHTRVRLLVRRGKPVAYIVNRHGVDADDYMKIWDFGGDPEAVIGLARADFETFDRSSLIIETPKDDTGVARLLRGLCLPFQSDYVGNLFVLRPQHVLEAYGVDDIQVTVVGEGWEVTYAGETIRYTKCELTKFLFGPERQPGKHTHPKLPLPMFYAHLDHM